jgi:uncharacterized membrane protein
LAASLIFAVSMLYLLDGLHDRYGTHTFDMAIFDQGVWLLSRFKEPFVTIRGLNVFADHTSYILLLIAPLYWIVANPHMLMVVAVGALAAGGPLTYSIARASGLSTRLSAALAFMYLLHPTVAWNVWDIFHPEVIAVPLLLGAYLFVLRNRWGWAVTLLILTLLVKEDAAVAVVPLGIFLAWRFKRVREGLGIAAFGTALLAFNMFVVLPAFSPTGSLTNNWRYAQFGNGIGGALKGMVTKPSLLFSELFGSDRLTYYLQLVGPIPTALLAPEILLLAAPITASNALSFHVHQYEIERHYTVRVLALGTIAAVSGATRLVRWLNGRTGAVVGVVLVAALVGSALVGPWTFLRKGDPWVGAAQSEESVVAIDAALSLIPRDAPVAADWFTAPHLASRETVYMLPNPFRNRYFGAGEAYAPTPDDIDWIVAQRWALGDDEVAAAFAAAQESGEWAVVVDNAVVFMLKRHGVPTRRPDRP